MILWCHKCLYITRICPKVRVLGGHTTGVVVAAALGPVAALAAVAAVAAVVFLYFRKKSESFMECDQQRALERLFQYSSNSFSSALLTLLCVLSPSTEKRRYMITSRNDVVS